MLCAIGSFSVHGPIIFWYLTRVFVYHAILAVQFYDYSMEIFELNIIMIFLLFQKILAHN